METNPEHRRDGSGQPGLLEEAEMQRFIRFREIADEDTDLVMELAQYPAHAFHVLHNYLAGDIKFRKDDAIAKIRRDAEFARTDKKKAEEQEVPARIYELLGDFTEKYDGTAAYALIRVLEEVLPKRQEK